MLLTLNLLGATFSIFLASLLFIQARKGIANSYLAAGILVIFSILMMNSIRILMIGEDHFQFFDWISNYLLLLIGPSLFLLSKSKSGSKTFQDQDLWHVLPFPLLIISHVCCYLFFSERLSMIVEIISVLFLIISIYVYVFYALKIAYSLNKKDTFLMLALYGFVVVWTANLCFQSLEFIIEPYQEEWDIAATFLLGILSIILTYQYWFELLDTMYKKKSRLKLNKKQAQNIKTAIQDFVSSEKPYLQSSYSLSELSKGINYPNSYVSHVINTEFGMSYPKFMSKYRIQEFLLIYNKDQQAKYTLMAMAKEVGFKSSSTFNSAFKENMGMLPSEYFKK